MRFERYLLLGCFLVAGCGSARVPEEPTSKAYRALGRDLRSAQRWTPTYVSTGLSTGIMLSAGGYSVTRLTIDLWRYPIDTAAVVVMEPVVDPAGRGKGDDQPIEYLEFRTAQVVLTASVNDLGQSFFKVPPGTYLVHPRLLRAPNVYIAGIEVREGSYAIVPVHPQGIRASLSGPR